MSLLKTIKQRRSIRAFQAREIPDQIIDELIEALIWAPSAGNLQSRKFYFVTSQEIKERLVRVARDQTFITEAPLVIVACSSDKIKARYGQRGVELYTIMDVAMSLENLFLLSQEKGLGTVCVGAFQEEAVSEILNIPKNLRPIAIVPVGYPAEKPAPSARVSQEEAVEWVE